MSRSGYGMRGVMLKTNNNNNNKKGNPYIKFSEELNKKATQIEKAEDNQIINSAGGYVYKVNDIDRFKRFLILGSEGGTFYIKEKELTKQNCELIIKLIKEKKGKEIIEIIKEYSIEGRCPKQNTIIFSLAACCRLGDLETKHRAYEILNIVCRIPTHLFMFIEYCELITKEGTGWGRMHKRYITNWYNNKKPRNLAYLLTKYQNRGGWTNRDVLRLAHIKAEDDIHNIIYHYVVKDREIKNDKDLVDEEELDTLDFLKAVEEVKKEDIKIENIIEYIRKYRLAREHIPNQWFSNTKIWEVLLEDMPITAMIRNLGKMSSLTGLFDNNNNLNNITKKITNEEVLKKGKVHPLVILNATNVYKSGQGDKGSLTWNPNTKILDALNDSFYKAFKTVEPTNKNWLLALDISGSMGYNKIANMSLTPREASAALALVTTSIENCHIIGFSHELITLDISCKRRLDNVISSISGLQFGNTDCALPMLYAIKHRLDVDVFVIYTDSETYYGKIHPYQAIRDYRRIMNKPKAKLIVVGMESNGFTIADPNDKDMLDVVGFDSSIPEIMRNFVMDEF